MSSFKIALVLAATGLLLQGCLAMAVGGAAVGVAGAAVGTTVAVGTTAVRGGAAVGRAVIPGDSRDDDEDDK